LTAISWLHDHGQLAGKEKFDSKCESTKFGKASYMNRSNTLCVLVFLCFAGCKADKEDPKPVDTEKPSLIIVEPEEGDTIDVSNGQLHIEFYSADNDKLSRLTVKLKNSADSVYFQDLTDISSSSYNYHEHFTIDSNTVHTVVGMSMDVGSSDKSGNLRQKTVSFYLSP
jgi:hypothetical protein